MTSLKKKCFFFFSVVASGGSTVVEHLPRHLIVKGLSPATATGTGAEQNVAVL